AGFLVQGSRFMVQGFKILFSWNHRMLAFSWALIAFHRMSDSGQSKKWSKKSLKPASCIL
ncbi:MAG: hypothetical protein PVH69_01560, partial [Desulfobacterales bacterium]